MSSNPLFDRLYDWIRSELDWNRNVNFQSNAGDPDLRSAEEELEAFLRSSGSAGTSDWKPGSGQRGWEDPGKDDWKDFRESAPDAKAAELARSYLELGLSPGATWEDVHQAHRALLKEGHPDKFAQDPEKAAQATLKIQKINEAYQNIKRALGK